MAIFAAMTLAPGCAAIWGIGDPETVANDASSGSDAIDGASDAPDSKVEASPLPDGTTSYWQIVLSDGPAAYFRLGERGCCVAADEQSGGLTGVYDDAGLVYGAQGAIKGDENTAVVFDGQHVITMDHGLDFTGTQPFSAELWAMRTGTSTGENFAIDHGIIIDGGAPSGWDLFVYPQVTGERRNDTTHGASYGMTDAALPSDGQYHHLVMTFDGSTFCLYMDGQAAQCNVGAQFVSIDVSNISWVVGNLNCGPGAGVGSTCNDGFVGMLDELAIYPYALDAGQVARHFAVGTGR